MLLAKSLILFVGVGAVSGMAFGLYLLDVKNTSQLVFVDGPSVSIVTEKSDFEQGETISISIINSGSVPLSFPDLSYGLRITGLSGILMYTPPPFPAGAAGGVGGGAAPASTVLEPGDAANLLWDQTKNNGNAALEGLYKISAAGVDEDGNRIEQSTVINILK